jgi:hypothetical protein
VVTLAMSTNVRSALSVQIKLNATQSAKAPSRIREVSASRPSLRLGKAPARTVARTTHHAAIPT